MKWKGEYTKTVQTIYDLGHRIKWEIEQSSREKKKQIIEKKKDKKEIEQQKKKRQVPRVRISILTGTAFAVQCSTHWAAGNLPWKEIKF